MPEQTLKSDLVDIVVIGQGQRAFAYLVDAVANGRKLDSANGIGYKDNGRQMFTPAPA